MVVGGEEGAAPRHVMQMLGDAPGNREAVEGRRSAANLIEQDEAPRGGVVQNVRRLVHLHHEGRVPLGEIVACADAGENPVCHADARRGGRDPASRLGHHGEQTHLSQVGRLAGHVRTSNDPHTFFGTLGRIEVGVVGNEGLPSRPLVEHGVTPVTDLQHSRTINDRPGVAEESRGLGKRAESVECTGGACCLLERENLIEHRGAKTLEDLDLECLGPLLGAEDFPLHLLELGGDESLPSRRRLLAGIVVGNTPEIRRGDLDEIAEDGVEADLQRLDAGAGDLLLLQGGDPGLSLGGGVAEFIK